MACVRTCYPLLPETLDHPIGEGIHPGATAAISDNHSTVFLSIVLVFFASQSLFIACSMCFSFHFCSVIIMFEHCW